MGFIMRFSLLRGIAGMFRGRPAAGLGIVAALAWAGTVAALATGATPREYQTALCVAAVATMGVIQCVVTRATDAQMARVLVRAAKEITGPDGPGGRRHLRLVDRGTGAGA